MNYSKICLILITICLIVITFTLGLSKSGIEWLREGYDLYKKAKYEEAVKSYKEALKEYPDSFEIHLSIGKCYSKLGDYEEAIKYYNKATDLNGENLFTVYYNKGKAYLALRDYREAIDCFNEALKIKPGNIEAKNRKEEAEKILGKEQYSNILSSSNREQNKKAIEYFNKGLKYFNNKDYERAILWFDEALNLYPLLEEAQNKKKEAENFLSLYKNHACEKWNLAEDFDTSNNLTGPWFFGYKKHLDSSLNLLPDLTIILERPVWLYGTDPDEAGNVWKNILSSYSYGIPPGGVGFHPSRHGEFTTVRWNSTFSGKINISGMFGKGDSGAGGTKGHVDVYILKNNEILFSKINTAIDEFFNLTVHINRGDNIDFEVGTGQDGNAYDNTLIEAKIIKK